MGGLVRLSLPTGTGARTFPSVATLFVGFSTALWLAPCVALLAQRVLTTEDGAFVPLVLISGLVTLWHEFGRDHEPRQSGSIAMTLLVVTVAAAAFALGRLTNLLALMTFAGWLGLVALLYGYIGWRAAARLWLPLLYLLLVIPLPYAIVGPLTQAVRLALSDTAIQVAAAFGLEVAVSGNALFIDQYELEMAAACTGLNSLLSLVATVWLYAYWVRRADWRRLLAILLLAIPIALGANLLRILSLLVLVHAFGSGVLATLLHPLTGLVSFVIASALLVVLDLLLARIGRHARP